MAKGQAGSPDLNLVGRGSSPPIVPILIKDGRVWESGGITVFFQLLA
ncbi:hypothetical protein [Moorena sp. SIO4A5]|nr:hypothetical protein [Moorena sp. SIO4A5]NEO19272.1 hypothetical protein [Moorena sp. SIO4A5]